MSRKSSFMSDRRPHVEVDPTSYRLSVKIKKMMKESAMPKIHEELKDSSLQQTLRSSFSPQSTAVAPITPGLKVTYGQLRKMDTLNKKKYIDQILSHDDQVNQYIKKVQTNAQKAQDKLVIVKMKIEDTQDDWDKNMQEINDKLYEKAVENGISKEAFYHDYQFQIFDITDMAYEKDHKGFGQLHTENCKGCTHNIKPKIKTTIALNTKDLFTNSK